MPEVAAKLLQTIESEMPLRSLPAFEKWLEMRSLLEVELGHLGLRQNLLEASKKQVQSVVSEVLGCALLIYFRLVWVVQEEVVADVLLRLDVCEHALYCWQR